MYSIFEDKHISVTKELNFAAKASVIVTPCMYLPRLLTYMYSNTAMLLKALEAVVTSSTLKLNACHGDSRAV